jgi:hypothetical protein
MGMSTHVVAFRDMDGEFAKMLEAKLFCDSRGLSYPEEVKTYFKGLAGESEKLLREEMLAVDISDIIRKWRDDGDEGYEVDVSQLPKEVKTIRFYNSW